MKNSLIVTLLIVTVTVSGQSLQPLEKYVDDLALKLIQKGTIKAISVGIIENGKTSIYHYGDLRNGNKPNDSSFYEIASITKTFTGLLLAQAVMDKKINLDEDVRKYLEGNFPNLEYQGTSITFRNLATHMAGLPYTFPDKPEIFVKPDYDKLPFILDSLERGFTKNDFFEDLHKVKIEATPGTQFKYSNVDANLLAYILENVYSKSYEDLLNEFIFKNALMHNTNLLLTSHDSLNVVRGYNTKGKEMPFVSISTRAAAGLKSTMPDMMKYVAFNLNETNPLTKFAHEQMWKADKGSYSSGYYWQMDMVKGDRKIFQNGGSFGTSSWLEFYPASQFGIFIVSNISGPEIHNQLSGMADKIYKILNKN